MKRIIFLLLLLPLSTFSQQKVCCRPIIVLNNNLPDTSGLVTDFDFSNALSFTAIDNKISSITDAIKGVVSSQSDSSKRPIVADGYATFSGSRHLTGALLTSSQDYTIFELRRVASTATTFAALGSFQNGTGNTGYGVVDMYGSSNGGNAGAFFCGHTSMESPAFYTSVNRWELIVTSHSHGANKIYNTTGNLFVALRNDIDPTTPISGHQIGACANLNNFTGDIKRILLYNRQLSDSEVVTMCSYFILRYSIPLPGQVNTDGDSITAGTSLWSNYPAYLYQGLLPTAFFYVNNSGTAGYNSQNILDSLQKRVLNKFNPAIKNVAVLMIGHNDFALSVSADTLFARTDSACQRMHRKGYKVILLTTLRTTAYSYTITDNYNSTLISNWHSMGVDSLVDIAAIPQLQDPTNTTYFSDGIHPTLPVGAMYITNAVSPVANYYLTH